MEIYIVKQGDTLENIASLYNVSVNDIIKVNNLKMPFNLEPGTALNIPLGVTNIFDYYTILKGDTLYSVAKKNNVTVNILSAINGLDPSEYIYPGQTILVPKKGVSVYITTMGDTIQNIARYFNTTVANLSYNNNNIYLLPDQLIVYRNM